jgi:hypothetical protein
MFFRNSRRERFSSTGEAIFSSEAIQYARSLSTGATGEFAPGTAVAAALEAPITAADFRNCRRLFMDAFSAAGAANWQEDLPVGRNEIL